MIVVKGGRVYDSTVIDAGEKIGVSVFLNGFQFKYRGAERDELGQITGRGIEKIIRHAIDEIETAEKVAEILTRGEI